MSAVLLRPATPEDAPSMAAIESLTMPEFQTFCFEDAIPGVKAGPCAAAHYARPGPDSYEWTWIAEQDGAAAGFLTAHPLSLAPRAAPASDRAAHLAAFRKALPDAGLLLARTGVLAPFRRGGLLRRLWRAATAGAEERAAYAFTWADNRPMRAFLESEGFAQTGAVHIAPHPRLTRHGDSLLFRKALP